MTKTLFGRKAFLALTVTVILLGLGAAGWSLTPALLGRGGTTEATSPGTDEEEGDASVLTVKAIRPHRNQAELVRTVTQPAYVQAYYKAELMARVAGSVREVHKNIGDRVRAGEALIEIDVPDLEQDLALKEANVKLADREAEAAEAAVDAVVAAAREATALVKERMAEVDRALARQKYDKAYLDRTRKLAKSGAVQGDLVDERQKKYESAVADVKSAQIAVESAKANVDEFQAKVASARKLVEVKKAQGQVARADRDRAKTMVGYATLRAPFDGVVVSRRADPGTFVQNASTGQPHALMTVLRTDKVTLVMWVPERESMLVSTGTEAIIRLDAARGMEFRGKVSRLSHWLDPDKSRDMRVEVDLVNTEKTNFKAGMYGSMTLVLQRFDKAWLLPASAVFVRAGRTWICEVRDGKAHLVPVRVQMQDGVRVKVVKLMKQADPKTGLDEEVPVELAGDEVIVRGGQGEVREGQEVQASVVGW